MNEESYTKYKDIRNMAWEMLIRFQTNCLPIDIKQIAEECRVTVQTYAESGELVAACGLEAVRDENRAFSVFTDRWYILYDDADEAPLFAIAHELAHILLKHPFARQKVGFFTASYSNFNRDELSLLVDEQDANTLATRLLAPACVLRRLKVCDAETMMWLCGLPLSVAEARAERMGQLIDRDKFFLRKDEERVFELFKDFIAQAPELFLQEGQEGQ